MLTCRKLDQSTALSMLLQHQQPHVRKQPAGNLCGRLMESLVAALTAAHVLLFDVRRPAEPIAMWRHGLAAPTFLEISCRAKPSDTVCLLHFSGRIFAARKLCILAFRFGWTPLSGQSV